MIDFCKKNKRILIFAFLSVFIVHMIKFVNYFPNWDSVFGIQKYMAGMSEFGRWLSGIITNFLASPYDLQWVEAVFSAVFIALSITLFIKIFEITNPKLQYLTIILFVTFPSIAATFAYHFWSPSYFCALFMSVLAIYICKENKWNKYIIFVVSSVLLTLSLAVYQIFYLFAALSCLFIIFNTLLNKNNIIKIKNVIRNFSVSLIGGAIFYVIMNKIILSVLGIKLKSYQGISETRFPGIMDLFNGMKKALTKFYDFFFGSYSMQSDFNFFSLYSIINTTLLLLLIICIVKFVFFNKKINTINKIVIVTIVLLIIPVGYGYYFISDGVSYHSLMEYGNYFIYFTLIIILQNCTFKFAKFKQFVMICLFGLAIYNFINTNVAYHQMSISYEKTYFQNVEIASRIDEVSDEKEKVVAIIGGFQDSGLDIMSNPKIEGAETRIFTWSQVHIIIFDNYYLGRSYIYCDDETREKIKNTNEFKMMKDFPSKDSVKVIDGIVVVRLSENDY